MARKKKDPALTFKGSQNLGVVLTGTENNLFIVAQLAKMASEYERMQKHLALHAIYLQLYEEIISFLKEKHK